MDPVTHTLIGAGMAQGFFRRRVGAEAVPILMIASNLPDVDVAVHFTHDPLAITLRRSFGHSLFCFPLWALALAWLLNKKYPRHKLKTLYGLCLLGAGVHVFFDLVNSFGVWLLWPFGSFHPELAIIFIIDLALAGLLAAPFLVCAAPSLRDRLERSCRLSMACVLAYVLFCGWNRYLATRALDSESSRLKLKPGFSYVFPEPFGPHRWRGVLREDDVYRVSLIHSLSGAVEARGEVRTSDKDPRVREVRGTPEARRLESFFKAPVWTLREESGRTDVSVYDLRFRSLLIGRGKPFEFHLRPPGN